MKQKDLIILAIVAGFLVVAYILVSRYAQAKRSSTIDSLLGSAGGLFDSISQKWFKNDTPPVGLEFN